MTRLLRQTVCYVLSGVPVEIIRESLGEELFKICYEEDEYILGVVGGTLKDFLNSFSTLLKQSSHCQEAEKRGGIEDGSILCLDKDEDFLSVYYFFPKRTTSLILPGIIKAAAHTLYETEVEVSSMPPCFHAEGGDVLQQPCLLYSVRITRARPAPSPAPGKPPSSLVIPVSLFCKTFPFHFMFDRDMAILQFGNGIRRLMSRRDFQAKPRFEEYFEILTPKISQTFSGILTMLNMQFVVRVRRWDSSVKKASRVMDLKGQMIYVVESSAVLFLGSPCVDRLEDFTGRGLYLSDIPIHNALRDVVLIGEQARAQDGLKKRLGKLKATLEQAHQALEEEKRKTVDLLCSIFPGEVAQQLWQGQVVQAKKFSDVTMLFSDIVGFTAICSQCSPLQVITMLNALYTRFDRQCGELDVYKVETIGDAYCVAGGLHKESDTHAVQIALMALKMMELSDEVMSPHGEPIKMRIGLHSGSVFAGVVGVKMPRYCLFGNNVTLANKFESCSVPRKINVSPTTYSPGPPPRRGHHYTVSRNTTSSAYELAVLLITVVGHTPRLCRPDLTKTNCPRIYRQGDICILSLKQPGLKEAQLDEEGQFLVRIIYDDSKTYDLVAAASKVLSKLNVTFLLWLSYKVQGCLQVVCDVVVFGILARLVLVSVGGADQGDDAVVTASRRPFSCSWKCADNLDALHDHLATIYPGMRAPSFRCTDAEKGKGLILHYYSEREGLQDIVIGIIKTVAQQIHGTEIDMKVIQQRNEECDHTQFLIEEKESKEEDFYEDLDRFEENGTQESRISPYTFCKAFPFHIIFDRNLVVTQCGNAIYRVLPQLQPGTCSLLSVFSLVRPHIDTSFHGILSHINTVFVLRSKEGLLDVEKLECEDELTGTEISCLRLKGQMIYLPEADSILFLCSPSVMNLDDLTRRGLYLSDIPLHDATRDLVLLGEQFREEYKLTQELEILTDRLQLTLRALEDEKKKTDTLLYSVLPPSVANELRHKRPVPAKRYDNVTILFSGIVGFNAFCSKHASGEGAMKIVNLLNDLYTRFDTLTDSRKNPFVYKANNNRDSYGGGGYWCHRAEDATMSYDTREFRPTVPLGAQRPSVHEGQKGANASLVSFEKKHRTKGKLSVRARADPSQNACARGAGNTGAPPGVLGPQWVAPDPEVLPRLVPITLGWVRNKFDTLSPD
ncbi:hypothetical protein CB1_000204006 [Camelus ferus]|nr:hypothetical protein CB1_000204006 [Camelus ferus]